MSAISHFDDDTRVQAVPDGAAGAAAGPAAAARWQAVVQPHWNIGAHPNGGYLLAIAAQALARANPDQPDPLSITVHYLRPGLPGQPAEVQTQRLRAGRTLSTVSATLLQAGEPRLVAMASLGRLAAAGPGHLAEGAAGPAPLALPPPDLPPPEACVGRSGAAQGVDLPILQRLDIRLHPDEARPGAAGRARVSGWIRFADGRAPDPLALLLMADAFPPSVFGLLGMVGWVPTVELTVHLRARPAPGWIRGAFWTEDLRDGRMVEDGALWDAEGTLVARVRQLALVRRPGGG